MGLIKEVLGFDGKTIGDLKVFALMHGRSFLGLVLGGRLTDEWFMAEVGKAIELQGQSDALEARIETIDYERVEV